MKIFAISDVHGHFYAMKSALDAAGFDSEDPDHLLICCGDCFDRGCENRKVLEYLSSLKRKILIRGNHEDILARILDRRYIEQVDIYNGADLTVSEFFGEENIDRHGRIDMSRNTDTVAMLRDFIGSMYDFYETDRHIFTHAWLPIVQSYSGPILFPDKEHAPNGLWKESRYNEWFSALEAGLTVEGKTVVCGHRASYNAYRIDESRDPEDRSMYVADGVAAIDSSTVRTGKVNVYVTEDGIPVAKEHSMSLMRKYFERMRDGKKTVEIRLFDEKRKSFSIGDKIVFSCADAQDQRLVRRIVGMHAYDSLEQLARDFSCEELGLSLSEIEDIGGIMAKIYSAADIDRHGFLAVRLSNII